MEMKLIADCGSTKIDWALCDDVRGIETFNSPGVNPVFMEPEEIYESFSKAFDTYLLGNKRVTEVYFYGAGCIGKNIEKVNQVLKKFFPSAMVMVSSDLLGAARALFHHEEGIACILGTGSNSCLFDGENIVKNVPPLGFVLGDEGSGSVLGRKFLNALYKGRLPEQLKQDFEKELKVSQADIIQRVYREPQANKWLASLSTFVAAHIEVAGVRQPVIDNFREFLVNNVRPYHCKDLPVSFVGSMAEHYQNELEEAARSEGFTVGQIVKSPMDGLVKYHCV
jgi:N-acetylglucosamine kinase-like BadF-type ATPase